MDKAELTCVRSILDRVCALEAQISVVRKDLEILIKIPKIEPEPERVFKPRDRDLIDTNDDYYSSFRSSRKNR